MIDIPDQIKLSYLIAFNKQHRRKVSRSTISRLVLDDEWWENKFIEVVGKCSDILVKEGLMFSREEVEAMDTINYYKTVDRAHCPDTTSLPDIFHYGITPDDELIRFGNESFYNWLPTIKEGVLRINDDRYLYFNELTIHEEDYKYGCHLSDMIYSHGCWSPEADELVVFGWYSGGVGTCEVSYMSWDTGGYMNTGMIFKNNEKVLKKNLLKDDILFLERVIYWMYAKDFRSRKVDYSDEGLGEKNSDEMSLATHFLMTMLSVNCELSKHRPSAPRGRAVAKRKVTCVAADEVKPRKQQIIRSVGSSGLSIKSVNIPKILNEETIRRYSVPSWATRGHVRHYKNGHTVYIKPSIHHRKCLMDKVDKAEKPQVIVELCS